jgi:glyoxylase-like metal-dependent hydrolase (beta-lactamase superfamily II)
MERSPPAAVRDRAIIYQPSLAGVRDWQFVDYTSGPFFTFANSQDLLGEGSLLLLPTPGHGPGHQCVLVRMDGYELLITGDILYASRLVPPMR